MLSGAPACVSCRRIQPWRRSRVPVLSLPSEKSARAALAELDVRLRVERAALPEGGNVRAAALDGLSALEDDRRHAALGQHQRSEEPRRAHADDHGPHPRQRGERQRRMVRALLPDAHALIAAAAQYLLLLPHLDGHGIYQLQRRTRVHRAAQHPQRQNLPLRHAQQLRRLFAQQPLAFAGAELELIQSQQKFFTSF